MEKDLSKLRPFSPEEAKAGGLMCDVSRVGGAYTYIAGPDAGGWIATENEKGIFIFSAVTNLFMLPLCWVEGEPVYPGDVLEHTRLGEVVAKGLHASQGMIVVEKYDGLALENLAWPRPKPVKRWINIYAGTYSPSVEVELHPSKEVADQRAGLRCLSCIEIELPPPTTEVKP